MSERIDGPKKVDSEVDSKRMDLDDEPKKLELTGVIAEKLPNNLFIVELENSLKVLAYVSGKMKMNCINILPNDRVTVLLDPKDKTKDGRFRARITYRAK